MIGGGGESEGRSIGVVSCLRKNQKKSNVEIRLFFINKKKFTENKTIFFFEMETSTLAFLTFLVFCLDAVLIIWLLRNPRSATSNADNSGNSGGSAGNSGNSGGSAGNSGNSGGSAANPGDNNILPVVKK